MPRSKTASPSTPDATQSAVKPATAASATTETPATPATEVVEPVAKRAAGKRKATTAKIAPSPEPAPAPPKPAKTAKPKLVRDSFTIPKDEYQVLDVLKRRALGLEQHVKKSELLRAGLQALNAMSDRSLLKVLAAVPTLKTGRPKGD